MSSQSTVRSKLLAALLSSWLVSPLAMAFAQLVGFANERAILVALLSIGAVAPILVLVNEALVPAVLVNAGTLRVGSQIALLALQAATVGSMFLYPTTPQVGAGEKLLAVGSGALGSFFSIRSAMLNLECVVKGRMQHRIVMLVAAIPGLATLVLFLILGLVRLVPGTDFRSVYAIAFVPAAVQWLFLCRQCVTGTSDGLRKRVPARVPYVFYIAGIVFFAAASTASMLRASIAARHERYAGLLLVALNSTFSLSFTLSKIWFLEGNRKSVIHHWFAVALLGGVSMVAVAAVRNSEFGFGVMLGFLLALQVAMSIAISALREYLYTFSAYPGAPAPTDLSPEA